LAIPFMQTTAPPSLGRKKCVQWVFSLCFLFWLVIFPPTIVIHCSAAPEGSGLLRATCKNPPPTRFLLHRRLGSRFPRSLIPRFQVPSYLNFFSVHLRCFFLSFDSLKGFCRSIDFFFYGCLTSDPLLFIRSAPSPDTFIRPLSRIAVSSFFTPIPPPPTHSVI